MLSTLVNKKELDPVQLRLAQLLNSDIEKSKLNVLIKDFNELITIYRSKIKVTDTKFTITSQKQELPVTVVNDFKSPVNVKLSTRALNGKVKVGAVEDIEILGKKSAKFYYRWRF